MKIINQNFYSKTNFCSKDLYRVNLKKDNQPLQVKAIQFDHSKGDTRLISHLAFDWIDTEYMKNIVANYSCRHEQAVVIGIASDKEDLSSKDIKSLVAYKDNITKGRKECEVLFLQASPEIANNRKSSIKGAGIMALYTVVKHAKAKKCKKVNLMSTNHGFYEHIGFSKEPPISPLYSTRGFYLDEKDYDTFLSKVEEEYKFDCNA